LGQERYSRFFQYSCSKFSITIKTTIPDLSEKSLYHPFTICQVEHCNTLIVQMGLILNKTFRWLYSRDGKPTELWPMGRCSTGQRNSFASIGIDGIDCRGVTLITKQIIAGAKPYPSFSYPKRFFLPDFLNRTFKGLEPRSIQVT